MKFGTSVKDYKATSSNSAGRIISWLKEGDNVLRFLEEYPEWTVYYQHFDRNRRRGYPCNNEDRANCPGCKEREEDQRMAEIEDREPRIWGAQKFYLVNVLTQQGYVNLYQIPASAVSSVERMYSKYDTITDREYTIVKYKGDDGRWKFDLERGDPDTIDLSQYKSRMADHSTALENAYNELWGPGTEAAQIEAPKAGKDTMRSTGWNDAQKMDKPPTEPAGAAEPEQEDEALTIDESDLRKMSAKELVSLIKQCELPVPETTNSNELADYLITKLNA